MVTESKKKQISIVYDKPWKKCVTHLQTLISQIDNVKSFDYSLLEYDKNMKISSADYCLYIGKKSSEDFTFRDCYNEFGVHIGYLGTRCFIRCEPVEEWNKTIYCGFENKLIQMFQHFKFDGELKLYKENIVYIKRQFTIGDEPYEGSYLSRCTDDFLKAGNPVADNFFKYNPVFWVATQVDHITLDKDENTIRYYQYELGIMTFVKDYLTKFMFKQEE